MDVPDTYSTGQGPEGYLGPLPADGSRPVAAPSLEVSIQNWLGKNWGLVAAGLGVLVLAAATKRR